MQQTRSLSRTSSAAGPIPAPGVPSRPASREGLHPTFGMQQQLAQQGAAQQRGSGAAAAAAGGLFSPPGPPVATPRIPREPLPAASGAGLLQGMSLPQGSALPQSAALLRSAALQQTAGLAQSAGLGQGGYGPPQQLGLAQAGFGQHSSSSSLAQQQQTLEQLQQLLSAKEAALQLLNSLAAQQSAAQQLGGEQPGTSLPQTSLPAQGNATYAGPGHLPPASMLVQPSNAVAALGRRGLSPLFLQQPGIGQPAGTSAFAAAQQQQALGAALGLSPETAARLLQAQAQAQASRSASGASLGRSGSLSAASTASSSSASGSGSQPSQRSLGQGGAPGFGPMQ